MDRRSKARQPCHPVWSLHLEAAFRSLAMISRHRITITRSMFPTCFFDVRRSFSLARPAHNSPA